MMMGIAEWGVNPFPLRNRYRHDFRCYLWGTFLGLVALFLFIPSALAQVETADILGQVSDASKAVVPGAKVTITNLATGIVSSVQSNSSGEFILTALPIGHYSVRIESAGFNTYTVPELILSQGDRARVNATLSIGNTETIEVGSVEPQLQTDSSVISTVVTERQVEDLPLDGRNFMQLAQTLVGANEGPPNALSSGNRPDDRRLTSSVSVNGQDENVNNQLIDGLDNNERIIGAIGVRPSVDAIAEFRVQTNLYTAEVGRTAGAIINIITKSGGNTYHGSLYEFFRNDIFDATDFFALTHVKLRQNQYGGSLGGPVLKDKMFFFVDYEGFRKVGGHTYTTTVPTLYEEQHPGDFSDISHTSVPSTAIDPIALQYFKLYPAPNRAPSCSQATLTCNSNNFTNSPDRVDNTHVGDGRLDYAFSNGDRVFVRYTLNKGDHSVPGTLPIKNGIAPGGNPYAFSGTSNQEAQNAQINYIHLFTPTVLGEFKVGYTHIDNQSLPLNYGKNFASQFGLKGANLGDKYTSALTPLQPVGYAAVGDGIYTPLENKDNTFQESGQITLNHGTQSIKIGGALIRRQASSQQSTFPVGFLQFNTYTQNGVSCAAMGCMLRGIVYKAQRMNQLVAPGFRSWEPSAYIQDDWRVGNRLTLNLGIRYDLFTPFTEAHNQLSNFDPQSASLLVAGVNGVSSTAGIKTDYSNVAPRIGFAAQLQPHTVLRGGFGMTYIPVSSGAKTSLGNAPYVYSYQSLNYTTTLSQGIPLPSVQPPFNLNATNIANFSLSGIDRHYRSAYIEQFNLTLQQEIGKNALTISYVSELGKHLRMNPNLNVAPPDAHGCSSPSDAAGANCYRPFLPFYSVMPNLQDANVMISQGVSNYNALQTTFSRRFTANLGINANYTWAHGLNDVANYALGGGGIGVIPSKIRQLDYGNSDLDIRDRFALLLNYAFPFGKRSSGIKARLIKGWQTNAIFIWSTGMPFSVTSDTAYSNTGALSGDERSLLVGDPDNISDHSISKWFNTAAFANQKFGTYVPSRRNLLFGPHYRVFNFSGFKTFPVHDSMKLQFRAEAFNLTNTPNFAQPDSGLGDGSFGTIKSTRLGTNPRQIQFALKFLF